MRKLYMLIGVTSLLYACNDIPDCNSSFTTSLVLQFRDSAFINPKLEKFDTVRYLNTDFIVATDSALSEVKLEISPDQLESKYFFKMSQEKDTLIIGYEKEISILSEECPPYIAVSGLAILRHTFKETQIINDTLLRNEVNIQVIL